MFLSIIIPTFPAGHDNFLEFGCSFLMSKLPPKWFLTINPLKRASFFQKKLSVAIGDAFYDAVTEVI